MKVRCRSCHVEDQGSTAKPLSRTKVSPPTSLWHNQPFCTTDCAAFRECQFLTWMCFRLCRHSDCAVRRHAHRHGRHTEFVINRHTPPMKHLQPKRRAPFRSAGSSAPLRQQLRSAPPTAPLRSANSSVPLRQQLRFAPPSAPLRSTISLDSPAELLRPAASPDIRAAALAGSSTWPAPDPVA